MIDIFFHFHYYTCKINRFSFIFVADMNKKSNILIRIVFYIAGFLIMTLGIAISVKSNLGVSPVSSIPYTMTCVWGIEMGLATIIFHVILVLLQVILLRKSFKIKNLLQIPVGILFGSFTTLCNGLMTFFPNPENLWIKLLMMLISTILIAIGIFLYVPASIIPLAGEGAMLAVSQVTKVAFSTVKLCFDSSMVIISLIVCLIALHSLGSVGIGTIIAAVLVGTELKLITKLFGSARDKILQKGKTTSENAVQNPLLKIMKSDVYTISENSSILDALKCMTEKKISGLPVVSENNNLVGFISDGDILRYLSAEEPLFVNSESIEKISFNEKLSALINQKVAKIASKKVFTVNSTDDLSEVCYKFAENHLKKAPVMENDKMIGMINASNILKYAVKMF